MNEQEPAILASFGFIFTQDRRPHPEGENVPILGIRAEICKSEKCRKEFVYLPNRKTGSMVPVDASSLSEDDVAFIRTTGRSIDVDFDGSRHVSHYKTCAEPTRFTRGKR